MTMAELSKKYGVHPTQIGTWKRAAIENMATAFAKRGRDPERVDEAQIEKLHSVNRQVIVFNRREGEDWPTCGGTGFFSQRLGSVARNARQKMVSRDHKLSVRRQCGLLSIARQVMLASSRGAGAVEPV